MQLLIWVTDIIIVALAGMTAWVGCDAAVHKVAYGNGPYSARNGAVAWVISCLLCWFVTFPHYLARRAQTLRDRAGAAPAWPVTVIVRRIQLLSERDIIAMEKREKKA